MWSTLSSNGSLDHPVYHVSDRNYPQGYLTQNFPFQLAGGVHIIYAATLIGFTEKIGIGMKNGLCEKH